jgi:predicted nucleotidyltransferase component of viral defense system
MFYTILDPKRQALLPLFTHFKDRFYLAGGTALALQIGHRDSIDFDFFAEEPIDTVALFDEVQKIFVGHALVKTQDERNTLGIIVDDSVKISFMSYPYKLIQPTLDEPFLRLATITDIGCMKLSAVVGRATLKDYVDLFYILKQIPLADLLRNAKDKFPSLDTGLILKSLVYFDDITTEPIIFTEGHSVSMDEIQSLLKKTVKELNL